jgi:hypothetical protein
MTRDSSTIQGETGIPIDPAYGTQPDRPMETAREAGLRQAEVGRQQAAEGLETLAGNIRRISSDLETQQPAMADAANSLAEQTERLASYLRETDTPGILRDVEAAARRRPLLFVGGAFVAGLAAARILRGPRG